MRTNIATADEEIEEIVNFLMEKFPEILSLPGILILITGQSGAGKNVHATILEKFLMEQKQKSFHFENGKTFLDFIEKGNPDSKLRSVIVGKTELQQRQNPLLPVIFTIASLKDKYTGEEPVFVNGSPRAEKELDAWKEFVVKDTFANFVYRDTEGEMFERIIILNLEVSSKEAFKRMRGRSGRGDSDTHEKIKNKMSWYPEVREFLEKVRFHQSNPVYDTRRIHLIDIDSSKPKIKVAKQIFTELYKFVKV